VRDVTALDRHLHERPPGPRFLERDFLEHDDAPYEAIVFNCSLHHLAPLDDALDRARALLAPGGLLVIDDFDVDAPDEPTAAFWRALAHDPGDEATALEAWRRHHDETPPLHPAAAMRAGIASRFPSISEEHGPYLHRYAHGDGRAFDAEVAALASGAIVPVGRRWVATG
jgi:SAM-dependent methyltransferase